MAALPPAGQAPHQTPTISPIGDAHANRFLYVFDYNTAQIDVLTFPQGDRVRTINDIGSLCTDPVTGNVIVVGAALDVYSAGGARFITSLHIPNDYVASGCTVDPLNGDIAAVGGNYVSNPQTGAVFIWSKNFNGPKEYADADTASTFYFGSYDNRSNLFVDGGFSGATLNELPRRKGAFVKIVAGKRRALQNIEGTVEWDGKYITVENPAARPVIYRLVVSGSSARVAATLKLRNDHPDGDPSLYTWIDGNAVLAPSRQGADVAVWRYPQGGKPDRSIGGFNAALNLVTGPTGPGLIDYRPSKR